MGIMDQVISTQHFSLAQFGPKLKDLSSGIQQSPATRAVGSAAAKGVREYLTAAKCLQSPRRVVAASRHWWIAAAPHFTPCLQKCLFPFFGPQSGRKLGWGVNKVGEGRDAGKEMHRGMHRDPRTQPGSGPDAGLCAASTHPKHFVFGRCPRACQDGQVRKPTYPQLPPPPHKPWQPAPHTLQRSCPLLLPLEACTDPQPGRVKGMLVSPTPRALSLSGKSLFLFPISTWEIHPSVFQGPASPCTPGRSWNRFG